MTIFTNAPGLRGPQVAPCRRFAVEPLSPAAFPLVAQIVYAALEALPAKLPVQP